MNSITVEPQPQKKANPPRHKIILPWTLFSQAMVPTSQKKKKKNLLVSVIKDFHVIKNQWSVSSHHPEYLSFPVSSTILFTLSSWPFWFPQTYTLLTRLRAQASRVFSSPSTCPQQRLLLPPQNSRRGCRQNAGGGGGGVQSLNYVWLCEPMDCSMPGFPVLHHLLEFAQTHVHWMDDAIQPSHPLSSPSPLALNLSQHQGLSQWVSSSHQVAKVLG